MKNQIKADSSAPYSPHQNGTAERAWRTLFDMARCLLIESKLPRNLWTYAVMYAAYTRNRCFNQRTGQTPFRMFTGKVPDVSKLHVFGSVCYSYERKVKKLDPRAKKGIFVGYDRSSPAYLVYDPSSRKISRHRCVEFTEKFPHSLDAPAEKKFVPTKVLPKPKPKPWEFDFEDDDDFPGIIHKNPTRPAEEVDGGDDVSEDDFYLYDFFRSDDEGGDDVEHDDDGNGDDVNNEIIDDNEHDDSVVEVDNPAAAEGEGVQGRRNPVRESRRLPPHLDEYVTNDRVAMVRCYRASSEIVVPKTYKEAVEGPESSLWKTAMDEEVKSLKENNTYTLVKLPPEKTCVGGRWVYALKSGPEGEDVFKARYVARGYTQKYGIDYVETFAPTAKFTTIRVFIQMAVELGLIIHQMDVKTAYLNAPIDVELYMAQIKGYEEDIGVGGKVVCKLNRSLYGLKQSGRNWNQMLHKFFLTYQFTQAKCDACVYLQVRKSGVILVLIWVDDMIIGASNMNLMNRIKRELSDSFRMKDMGSISWFLGIRFVQGDGYIEMDQCDYIKKKLKQFKLSDAKPRATPCETGAFTVVNSADVDNHNYREMVGSIIYAMTCTRPDLSWVVTKLSQHLNDPTPTDAVMVKHVFRYLLGTVNNKLRFTKSGGGLELFGFSDADWGANEDNRKSISGYYFSLNQRGPAISWKSKRQATVALSSCESEYIALTHATQEALYLSQLLADFLPTKVFSPTVIRHSEPIQINADNQGAIRLSRNPVHHSRSKHFDIKYHFIRDTILSKKIDTVYVPSEENIADMMTKPFSKLKLRKFWGLLFGDRG